MRERTVRDLQPREQREVCQWFETPDGATLARARAKLMSTKVEVLRRLRRRRLHLEAGGR